MQEFLGQGGLEHGASLLSTNVDVDLEGHARFTELFQPHDPQHCGRNHVKELVYRDVIAREHGGTIPRWGSLGPSG